MLCFIPVFVFQFYVCISMFGIEMKETADISVTLHGWSMLKLSS